MVDSSIQTLTHKLHKEFLSETTNIYTWAKQGIQERKEGKESILVMAQKMDLSLKGLAQKFKNLIQAHIHMKFKHALHKFRIWKFAHSNDLPMKV